ncbi:MAG: signal recognition particle-docking protein FtsY [Dehalococcoidia bacterium]|nr:MAG: signal recognition particle-docking protein FtsY [Dehalococcoidia bacterium]
MTGFKVVERLEKGVKRTREGWFMKVVRLFDRATVEEGLWEELEELLISADVGVNTTAKLIQKLRERVREERLREGPEVRSALREEMVAMLRVDALREATQPISLAPSGPTVILAVGVNGTGKTLSIAKLAYSFKEQGKRVILAAADTFRAAAIDQLKILGQRVGVDVISHQPGADPGAVVFDSLEAASSRHADVVIIDTAGRLHTKFNLMEELKKIKRVASRGDPRAPHEVLLVLDAITGQNGLSQAKYFTEAVGVTGVFLAKLDGTAKGGIVLAICDELKIPILFIGTGEALDDLAPFDAETFVEALSS